MQEHEQEEGPKRFDLTDPTLAKREQESRVPMETVRIAVILDNAELAHERLDQCLASLRAAEAGRRSVVDKSLSEVYPSLRHARAIGDATGAETLGELLDGLELWASGRDKSPMIWPYVGPIIDELLREVWRLESAVAGLVAERVSRQAPAREGGGL